MKDELKTNPISRKVSDLKWNKFYMNVFNYSSNRGKSKGIHTNLL